MRSCVRRAWIVWAVGLAAASQAFAAGQPLVGRLVVQPPTPQLAAQLRQFKARYGQQAVVLWNPVTRLPARLSRLDTKLAPRLSVTSVDLAVRQFLQTNRDFLRVPASGLKQRMALARRGRVLTRYQQTYEGIPIEGASLGCVSSTDGSLLDYRSSCIPAGVRLPTTGRVSMNQAEGIAMQAAGPAGQEAVLLDMKKYIRPAPNGDPAQSRLIYKALVRTAARDRNPDRMVVIDANTGEVLQEYAAAPSTITGAVRGRVRTDAYNGPTALRPMKYLAVKAQLVSMPFLNLTLPAVTNSSGAYTIPAPLWSWRVTAGLSGTYARVTSASQTNVRHSQVVNFMATHNWDYSGSGVDEAQVSVYYHINRLHDELYKNVLGYSWSNSWTNTPQFRAETGYSFNNSFAGSPIKFGSNSNWSAEVVYHESTHNVLFSIFGKDWVGHGYGRNKEGYAFDEGFADFFACVMLNRSNMPAVSRNLSNTLDYATNYNASTNNGLEGHSGGEIIAGAAWDLRQILIARYGQAVGSRVGANLVFDALATLATKPRPYRFSLPGTSNLFDALLETDDQNNNLSDGTPHDREIFQAFRNHGMLPVDVLVRDHATDDGDVPSNVGGAVWWLSPDINIVSNNTVRVRVRNVGYQTASSVTVKVYTSNLFSSLPYPSGWSLFGSRTVANLAPGASAWTGDITKAGANLSMLSVMARFETNADPMTEPGSVTLENNMAKRSVAVVVLRPQAEFVGRYLVRHHMVKGEFELASKKTTVDIVREGIKKKDESVEVEWLDPRRRVPLRMSPTRERGTVRMVPTLAKAAAGERTAKVDKALADLDRTLVRQRIVKPKVMPRFRPEVIPPAAVAAARPIQPAPREAAPTPAASPAPTTVAAVDSFSNVTEGIDGPILVSVKWRVPADARPGDQFAIHIAEKVNGEVVDGLTYQIQVQR